MMLKHRNSFSVYSDNATATNLSMIAGGIRLLSWLVLAAAAVSTLLILVPAVRVISLAGLNHGLYYLLDELDEVLVLAFGLWCVFAVFRYGAAVIEAKVGQLVTQLDVTNH